MSLRKEDNDPNIAAPVVSKPIPAPVEAKPPAPEIGTMHSDSAGRFVITGKVLELTKHFEGLVLVAEDDGYGTPTIGYGRITYPDGKKVRNGDRCTEAQANTWLLDDLWLEGMKYVRAMLKDEIEAQLSPDAISVYVDLCFNRGCGRFRDHVAPLLNAGRFDAVIAAVSDDIALHSVGSGYNLGLHRRRWAERLILEGKDWRAFDTVAKFRAFKERGYK